MKHKAVGKKQSASLKKKPFGLKIFKRKAAKKVYFSNGKQIKEGICEEEVSTEDNELGKTKNGFRLQTLYSNSLILLKMTNDKFLLIPYFL